MPIPNFVILYVDDPQASGTFYGSVLEAAPVENSPTFVLFAFEGGAKLGLWSRHTVQPDAAAAGGGGEVALAVETAAAVDAMHAAWAGRGISILHQPFDMDFGRSFVATDPDGHRLRVYCRAG